MSSCTNGRPKIYLEPAVCQSTRYRDKRAPNATQSKCRSMNQKTEEETAPTTARQACRCQLVDHNRSKESVRRSAVRKSAYFADKSLMSLLTENDLQTSLRTQTDPAHHFRRANPLRLNQFLSFLPSRFILFYCPLKPHYDFYPLPHHHPFQNSIPSPHSLPGLPWKRSGGALLSLPAGPCKATQQNGFYTRDRLCFS